MATAATEEVQEQVGLVPLEELESRLDKCRGLLATEPSAMRRTILIAQAVRTARAYIKRCMKDLVDLQGTTLGFDTDRQYTELELLNPLTEAAVIGLPFCGNCTNVLGNNLYIPVNGWEHRFRTSQRVTWPRIRLGSIEDVEEPQWIDLPPEKHYMSNNRKVTRRAVPGIARVEATGSCQCDGVEVRVEFLDHRATGGFDERVSIRVNHGMGDDAVLTKVRRKTLKYLWIEAHGAANAMPGSDADDDGPGPGVVDPVGPVTATTVPVAQSAAPVTETITPTAETITSPQETIVDPEPGSYEEFHSLLLRAGTVKVAGEIRDQYGFDGDLAARANEAFARRKSELRQQAEQRT